jgi:hypothetical protein
MVDRLEGDVVRKGVAVEKVGRLENGVMGLVVSSPIGAVCS